MYETSHYAACSMRHKFTLKAVQDLDESHVHNKVQLDQG
jgi:hypothetical protein